MIFINNNKKENKNKNRNNYKKNKIIKNYNLDLYLNKIEVFLKVMHQQNNDVIYGKLENNKNLKIKDKYIVKDL